MIQRTVGDKMEMYHTRRFYRQNWAEFFGTYHTRRDCRHAGTALGASIDKNGPNFSERTTLGAFIDMPVPHSARLSTKMGRIFRTYHTRRDCRHAGTTLGAFIDKMDATNTVL